MAKREKARTLTVAAVERLRPPKEGRIEMWDAALPGFGLRVSARGSKTWCLMTRLHGKQRRYKIGRMPVMGLLEARETARDYLRDIARGIDPQGAHGAEAAAIEDTSTFGVIAQEYIRIECLERKLKKGKVLPPKLKRGREVEAIIRRELMPIWWDKPFANLRRRDAIKQTEALVDAGKPAAAHRLYEVIRRIGRWATRRDMIDVNPFADMDPPVKKVARDRVLEPNEIKAVWGASGEIGYPFGPLCKLLLVTAQRRSEVASMRWSEIDRDNTLWIIPADRTKSGRETEVPLSTLAMEILDGLPQLTDGADGENPFVFTTTNGRRPVSGFSKMKKRTDARILKAMRERAREQGQDPELVKAMPHWRNHDLRRTARTGLAELGVPQIVAEKVLNHAERNALVKTYDRHEYAAEKRDALERWALRLREIIEPPPDNVVPLKGAQ